MIEVSIEPLQFFAGRESELAVRFTNTGSGTCTHIVFKLGLPPEFLLLRGRNRIEIPEIRAGEDYSYSAIVQPGAPGDFAIDSTNFSYRNNYGGSVRVSDFRAELSVLPAAEVEDVGPPLRVEWAGQELALREHDLLRLRVRNTTESPLRGLVLTVSGPIRITAPGPRVRLPDLAAGEESEVSFVVVAADSGRYVPVHVHAIYTDKSGRTRGQDDLLLVVVVSRQAAEATSGGGGTGTPRQDTILYLAASPTDMALLRSDKEMREVREQLQLGRYRDRFRLESRLAARFRDIGQALVDCNPRIVHFSGHGEQDGSLDLEDELGYSTQAAPEGLAALFAQHAATVDCVIVNACHTMRLAEAMIEHFDHVIAMRGKIGDGAAITFSIGFYQGLAGGLAVPGAFARGRAFLQAQQPSGKPEHDTPLLLERASTTRSGS
jgi:CHAT domain